MAKLSQIGTAAEYPPPLDWDAEDASPFAPPSQFERALALAAQNIPVLLCRPHEEINPQTGEVLKAKRPLTPNGFKDATTDPIIIRSWFTRRPDGLVGYATGEDSGIDVLDLDRKDGKDGVAAIERVCPNLPATFTRGTPSGGEHRLYRHRAGCKVTSTSNLFKKTLGAKETGIDTRGDSGYAIWWYGSVPPNVRELMAYWPEEIDQALERDRKAREPRKANATRNSSNRFAPNLERDYERISAALEVTPADAYEDWLHIGMAIKAHFGEKGRALWDRWSGTSSKFDAHEQDKKWKSFNGSGIRLGTLFDIAKDYGYRPTRINGVRPIVDWDRMIKRATAGEATSQLSPDEDEAAQQEDSLEDADEQAPEATAVETKGKPVLCSAPGSLNFCVSRAMEELVARGVDIFQRGNKLLRVALGRGITSKGRVILVPVLLEVDQAYMRLVLSRYICWIKPDGRVKQGPFGAGFRQIEAPETVAKAILSSVGEWPFRSIAGVIGTPTLRYDGSVLDQPGYDPGTHLYLESSVSLPPLITAPTKDDAEAALQLLERLLLEFPFVDNASKAVALSAMLTAVARSMFEVAPAHGARAPTAGTGKSYLFDIVAAIVLGERCPVISVSEDANETEKRVVAMALSGFPIIHLDNVNGELAGDALCQLIERPVCLLRPLGQSTNVRVDNRAIVFFNGNNCHVKGDMTRRVLVAELDAEVERPAEREFTADPVATVLADRGKYIAACMTVLRAYICAGRPKQAFKPMNSFEEWSSTVRSALVWLKRADPCKTINKARAEDPELQRLATFVAAFRSHADGKEEAVSVSKLVELSDKINSVGKPKHPELHTFVQAFVVGRQPNLQRLGRWLGKFKGRVVGDGDEQNRKYFRIASVYNTDRKGDDWYIETMQPVEAPF